MTTVEHEQRCIELALRFAPQCEGMREPGQLFHRLMRFLARHGRSPSVRCVRKIARRLRIDLHRTATRRRSLRGITSGSGAGITIASWQRPVSDPAGHVPRPLTLQDVVADPCAPLPSDTLRCDQLAPVLSRALGQISPVRRAIVRAVYLRGQPQRTVAARRGCNESAVSKTLAGALRELHTLLAPDFPELAA